MKNLGLILLAFLLVASPLQPQLSGAPVPAIRDNPFANLPVLLSINGGGRVIRFNPDMLSVDDRCLMWAVANPGYVFVNWQRANVFIFTEVTVDGAGQPVFTTSTVWSPIPEYQRSSFLEFTEQLDDVIFDAPGVETIIQGQGWVANFAPLRH